MPTSKYCVILNVCWDTLVNLNHHSLQLTCFRVQNFFTRLQCVERIIEFGNHGFSTTKIFHLESTYHVYLLAETFFPQDRHQFKLGLKLVLFRSGFPWFPKILECLILFFFLLCYHNQINCQNKKKKSKEICTPLVYKINQWRNI